MNSTIYSTITETCVGEMDFRPVSEDDIPLLRCFFDKANSRSNDFSVGGLLMWVEYFDYEIAVVEDSLIIKGRDPESGKLIFYQPCGTLNIGRYCEMVAAFCAAHNEHGLILSTSSRNPEEHDDTRSGHCERVEAWKEYLYDIERFVSFGGRKMEKKRNHLNFFINNYSPFDIEPISTDNIAELIAFTLAFSSVHADSELANYECRHVVGVLHNFDLYPFEGLAIRKDGHIIGYTFGEVIGDTCFVHAEKADIAYRGIYQLLAAQMAKLIAGKYPEVRFLNREEDMGDESLRLSKESYHPCLYIDKNKIEI